MYTVVKNSWEIRKKVYLLQWLYTFYLRVNKPLVIARGGVNGIKERKAATDHILKCYELRELLHRQDDDVKKAALVKEAMKHHQTNILGTQPLSAPLNVVAAIGHMNELIGRIRALGRSCY
jgi:triphosphoribosyl-dephospho-CoA synthetase